jgi:hypothetical protein
MAPGLTWQLLLRAEPAAVFAILAETAVAHDRLHSVDEAGQSLIFTPVPGTPGPWPTLRACVQERNGCALVVIGPAERVRRPESEREQAAQAASIGSLVHEVRRRLGRPRAGDVRAPA